MSVAKIDKNRDAQIKNSAEFDYLSDSGLPYSQFYEHVSTPIVVISSNYQIEYLNKAAEKFYNLIRKNSIGNKCSDEFNCELDKPTATCPVSEVLNKEESLDMRVENHLGVDNCYVRAFPLKDVSGEINSVVIEDFTRLTSATSQAVELRSRFRKTVELAVDAIFVLRENFIIEFANTYAVGMIGEPIEDIEGADFRDFFHDEKVIDFLEKTYRGEDNCESVCYYSEKAYSLGKKI